MLFGLFILLSKDLVVEEGKVRIEKGIIPNPWQSGGLRVSVFYGLKSLLDNLYISSENDR